MDMLNNLETDTYECNAMNALVVMAQIKAFIKELEFYISLQERRNWDVYMDRLWRDFGIVYRRY